MVSNIKDQVVQKDVESSSQFDIFEQLSKWNLQMNKNIIKVENWKWKVNLKNVELFEKLLLLIASDNDQVLQNLQHLTTLENKFRGYFLQLPDEELLRNPLKLSLEAFHYEFLELKINSQV